VCQNDIFYERTDENALSISNKCRRWRCLDSIFSRCSAVYYKRV